MQPISSPLFSIKNRSSVVTRSATKSKKHRKETHNIKPKISSAAKAVLENVQLLSYLCSYLSPSIIYSIKGISRFFNKNGNEIIRVSFINQLRAMKSLDMFYLQKYFDYWPDQKRASEINQKDEQENKKKTRKITIAQVTSYCINIEKIYHQFNYNSDYAPILSDKEILEECAKLPKLKNFQTSLIEGLSKEKYNSLADIFSTSQSLEDIKICDQINDETVSLLSKIKNLNSLHIEHSPITEVSVKFLKEVPNLTRVGLNFCPQLSSRTVNILSDIPRLQHLSIHCSNDAVRDNWFHHFPQITDLQSLELRSVSDHQLGLLVPCKNLTSLSVWGQTTTDEGMPHLAHFKKLTSLSIKYPSITDEGTKVFQYLPNLTYLNLLKANISNPGATNIAIHLPKLTDLDIEYTHVTDEGLITIADHLSELKILNITNMSVKDRSIKAIGRKLINLVEIKMKDTISDENSYPHITKPGLEALAQCQKLRRIYLNLTRSIRYGLISFGSLPDLEKIVLNIPNENKIDESPQSLFNSGTKEALKTLLEKKPGIEIIIDGGYVKTFPLIFDLPSKFLG